MPVPCTSAQPDTLSFFRARAAAVVVVEALWVDLWRDLESDTIELAYSKGTEDRGHGPRPTVYFALVAS